MTNINITSLSKDLFKYIDSAVTFGDIINVNTENGNAVIMSEEEYNGILETFRIYSNPKLMREILESMDESTEEMTKADEVDWDV